MAVNIIHIRRLDDSLTYKVIMYFYVYKFAIIAYNTLDYTLK